VLLLLLLLLPAAAAGAVDMVDPPLLPAWAALASAQDFRKAVLARMASIEAKPRNTEGPCDCRRQGVKERATAAVMTLSTAGNSASAEGS